MTNWPNGNAERCCGHRKENGVYWEVGFGPGGKPPEFFVIDPPQSIPTILTLPAQGVVPLRDHRTGVTHLLAHIGSMNYATPADYFEEYSRLGVSWRIPSSAPFHLLSAASKLLLAHAAGRILVPGQTYAEAFVHGWQCLGPLLHPEHIYPNLTEPCAGLWREALPADARSRLADPAARLDPQAAVYRTIPASTYAGRLAPRGIVFEEAFCFRFPLGRFVVVSGELAAERSAKIASADLPVAIVEC